MRVFDHPYRDFGSRGDAEPIEDGFNVAFDRVRRNNQSFSNLSVHQSAGNQRGDLMLPRCERHVRGASGWLDLRGLERFQHRVVERECLAN